MDEINARVLHPYAEGMLSPSVRPLHDAWTEEWVRQSDPILASLGDALAGRVRLRLRAGHRRPSRQAFWRELLETSGARGTELLRLAQEQYAVTQRIVGEVLGWDDTITLYRGVGSAQTRTLRRAWAAGDRGQLGVHALSSWSDRPGLPSAFAMANRGVVVRAEVPRRHVFADWRADAAIEHNLRRAIAQHFPGYSPEMIGGETLLWTPARQVPIGLDQVELAFD